MITKTIAFTGHRPHDLPPEYSFVQFCRAVDAFLGNRKQGGEPVTYEVVAGGALGIDAYAAEWAISRHYPLHLVLPFSVPVMTSPWNSAQKMALLSHIEHAASVTIIEPGAYRVEAYQERNVAMIDRAQAVMAFWRGKKTGGTANAVRYAIASGKPTFQLLLSSTPRTPVQLGAPALNHLTTPGATLNAPTTPVGPAAAQTALDFTGAPATPAPKRKRAAASKTQA